MKKSFNCLSIIMGMCVCLLQGLQGQETERVSLLFMGDVMGHDTQINSAWVDSINSYDYHACFDYIRDEIQAVDLSIANLEVTLAGEPYKGYPSFSSPDKLADALIDAGVDVLVTANNHCVDRGKKGLERTNYILDRKGVPRTGTFTNLADREQNNPLKFEINGIRLLLLNYTYGTNGLPVTEPNSVNLIDTALIRKDLHDAAGFQADKIIVFLHWGAEYQTQPNVKQKTVGRFLMDQGVDLVIGSHPHVIQPIVWERDGDKESFIVYSLGNFISNQRPTLRDGGMMVRVDIEKDAEGTSIVDAGYRLTWVHTPIERGRKKFYILPAANYENDEMIPGKEAGLKMNAYLKEARQIMMYNKNVAEIK
jgi:poly-gamma-glutamate synthesis protein (capsule biosynthesis protein)